MKFQKCVALILFGIFKSVWRRKCCCIPSFQQIAIRKLVLILILLQIFIEGTTFMYAFQKQQDVLSRSFILFITSCLWCAGCPLVDVLCSASMNTGIVSFLKLKMIWQCKDKMHDNFKYSKQIGQKMFNVEL